MRAPAFVLAPHQLREFLMGTGGRGESRAVKPRRHLGHGHDVRRLVVEALHDGVWQASGANQPVEAAVLDARNGVLHCRHLGQARVALVRQGQDLDPEPTPVVATASWPGWALAWATISATVFSTTRLVPVRAIGENACNGS
jgi:hypothetical protein